jgi:hypothetical protein
MLGLRSGDAFAIGTEYLVREVVDYVLEKFESGLLRELKNVASEMDRQQSHKRELEGELANLTRVLASVQLSSTIMIAIAERERGISEITELMFLLGEDSIKSRIAAMRTTAKSKLREFTRLTGLRCNCYALCVVESYR